ncbi:hypothetical protein D3C80_1390070 [compost metagenome]
MAGCWAGRRSRPRVFSVPRSVMAAGTWSRQKATRSTRWASMPWPLMAGAPTSKAVTACSRRCRPRAIRWRRSMARVTTTTAMPLRKGVTSSRGAGSTFMPPISSAPMASLAHPASRASRQPIAHRRCWMPRAGRRTRSTACKPGVSIPWVTGATLAWARPSACPIPCRCQSLVTMPASAPAWTGGAACPTPSTLALPWLQNVPSPSLPGTTAMTPG